MTLVWFNDVMACQVFVLERGRFKTDGSCQNYLKKSAEHIFIPNLIPVSSSWVLYLVSDVSICLESYLLKTVNIDNLFNAAIFL